jgi:hypothetical protein
LFHVGVVGAPGWTLLGVAGIEIIQAKDDYDAETRICDNEFGYPEVHD